MASVHPCKHALSYEDSLLDRADCALKLRRERLKAGAGSSDQGMEGLVDEIKKLDVSGVEAAAENPSNEEWRRSKPQTRRWRYASTSIWWSFSRWVASLCGILFQ